MLVSFEDGSSGSFPVSILYGFTAWSICEDYMLELLLFLFIDREFYSNNYLTFSFILMHSDGRMNDNSFCFSCKFIASSIICIIICLRQ